MLKFTCEELAKDLWWLYHNDIKPVREEERFNIFSIQYFVNFCFEMIEIRDKCTSKICLNNGNVMYSHYQNFKILDYLKACSSGKIQEGT